MKMTTEIILLQYDHEDADSPTCPKPGPYDSLRDRQPQPWSRDILLHRAWSHTWGGRGQTPGLLVVVPHLHLSCLGALGGMVESETVSSDGGDVCKRGGSLRLQGGIGVGGAS